MIKIQQEGNKIIVQTEEGSYSFCTARKDAMEYLEFMIALAGSRIEKERK